MPSGPSEAYWPQRREASGPPGEASDGRSVGEAPSAGDGVQGSRCPWSPRPPSVPGGDPTRGRYGRGGTASAHATDRRAGRRIGVSDPCRVWLRHEGCTRRDTAFPPTRGAKQGAMPYREPREPRAFSSPLPPGPPFDQEAFSRRHAVDLLTPWADRK